MSIAGWTIVDRAAIAAFFCIYIFVSAVGVIDCRHNNLICEWLRTAVPTTKFYTALGCIVGVYLLN